MGFVWLAEANGTSDSGLAKIDQFLPLKCLEVSFPVPTFREKTTPLSLSFFVMEPKLRTMRQNKTTRNPQLARFCRERRAHFTGRCGHSALTPRSWTYWALPFLLDLLYERFRASSHPGRIEVCGPGCCSCPDVFGCGLKDGGV